MTALSEYISGLTIDRGMSVRRLAELADIAPQTAWRLVKGRGKAADETLERVAAVLPEANLGKMRELAGRPDEEPRPFEAPREWALLTDEERRVIVSVGRQILKSSGRLDPEIGGQMEGVTRIHATEDSSE